MKDLVNLNHIFIDLQGKKGPYHFWTKIGISSHSAVVPNGTPHQVRAPYWPRQAPPEAAGCHGAKRAPALCARTACTSLQQRTPVLFSFIAELLLAVLMVDSHSRPKSFER